MTMLADKLPDSEIGERLRIARESAKHTQASAAKAIDVAGLTNRLAIVEGFEHGE